MRDIIYLTYPSGRLAHRLDFRSSNYEMWCFLTTPSTGTFNHTSPSPAACSTLVEPIIIHHGIRSDSHIPRTASVRHKGSKSGPSVRSWALSYFNFFRGCVLRLSAILWIEGMGWGLF